MLFERVLRANVLIVSCVTQLPLIGEPTGCSALSVVMVMMVVVTAPTGTIFVVPLTARCTLATLLVAASTSPRIRRRHVLLALRC